VLRTSLLGLFAPVQGVVQDAKLAEAFLVVYSVVVPEHP